MVCEWIVGVAIVGVPLGLLSLAAWRGRQRRILMGRLLEAMRRDDSHEVFAIAKSHPWTCDVRDLAQVGSDLVAEKVKRLELARSELEKFTRFLEKRCETRTRELKAAQDELIALKREFEALRKSKS